MAPRPAHPPPPPSAGTGGSGSRWTGPATRPWLHGAGRRLADFSPGKRTIERADVDSIVAEFRAYLLSALAAGEDELPVIELE